MSGRRPSALGDLHDEIASLEDTSLRVRLQWAITDAERREACLQGALRKMEMAQVVDSNIETLKDFYAEGLRRAMYAIEIGRSALACRVIDAALSFHPMHAESWQGWPKESEAPPVEEDTK